MADEKRQLVLDLLSRNKMGAGTSAAARDIDKVGTAADAAGKKTRFWQKSSEQAEQSVDGLGDASAGTARQIGKLDREIDKVNRDLLELAQSFAMADNAAERIDISKGIRKSQGELKKLKTSKGILDAFLPDPEPVAKSFMRRLGGALDSAGSSIATGAGKHVGLVIGGVVAAAAAPVIVAGISGAFSAGAGLTGIGAGVALAVAKDKDILQAGQAAGKRFVDGLTKAASGAYKQPIMTSIGILSAAGDRISKKWAEVFASTSGMLVPFVQDVVRAGEKISDSLAGAAIRSAPAVDALGDSIVLLGNSISTVVDILSSGGQNAASTLQLIVGVTGDAVAAQARFLGMLNDISANPWLTGPILPLLRKHYQDAAESSDDLSDRTKTLAGTLTDATRAANGNKDALVSLSNEMRAQADPVFALREAQVKLSEAQKASADSIKKHGRNSKEAKAATRDLATAALDLQSKVGALGEDFDGKLTPAMHDSLRAANLTEGQIRDVEKEFGAARRAGDRYAKNYSANAKVYGTSTVRKSLYSVRDAANSIPRAVTIAMRITGVGNVSAAAAAVRKNARASGGPVARGIPYLVGEHGPEMVVPEAAGRVMSAAATRGATNNRQGPGTTMVGGGGRGGAGSVLRVELVGPEESRVWFRKMVRTMNILPDGYVVG